MFNLKNFAVHRLHLACALSSLDQPIARVKICAASTF